MAMLLFTVIACYVTALFKPEVKLINVLTIGLGYAALIQLAVTPTGRLHGSPGFARGKPSSVTVASSVAAIAGITTRLAPTSIAGG